MIEDVSRKRCNFYEIESIDENKIDELMIIFSYEISKFYLIKIYCNIRIKFFFNQFKIQYGSLSMNKHARLHLIHLNCNLMNLIKNKNLF